MMSVNQPAAHNNHIVIRPVPLGPGRPGPGGAADAETAAVLQRFVEGGGDIWFEGGEVGVGLWEGGRFGTVRGE